MFSSIPNHFAWKINFSFFLRFVFDSLRLCIFMNFFNYSFVFRNFPFILKVHFFLIRSNFEILQKFPHITSSVSIYPHLRARNEQDNTAAKF